MNTLPKPIIRQPAQITSAQTPSLSQIQTTTLPQTPTALYYDVNLLQHQVHFAQTYVSDDGSITYGAYLDNNPRPILTGQIGPSSVGGGTFQFPTIGFGNEKYFTPTQPLDGEEEEGTSPSVGFGNEKYFTPTQPLDGEDEDEEPSKKRLYTPTLSDDNKEGGGGDDSSSQLTKRQKTVLEKGLEYGTTAVTGVAAGYQLFKDAQTSYANIQESIQWGSNLFNQTQGWVKDQVQYWNGQNGASIDRSLDESFIKYDENGNPITDDYPTGDFDEDAESQIEFIRGNGGTQEGEDLLRGHLKDQGYTDQEIDDSQNLGEEKGYEPPNEEGFQYESNAPYQQMEDEPETVAESELQEGGTEGYEVVDASLPLEAGTEAGVEVGAEVGAEVGVEVGAELLAGAAIGAVAAPIVGLGLLGFGVYEIGKQEHWW